MISYIVPAYNEERLLGATLRAFTPQPSRSENLTKSSLPTMLPRIERRPSPRAAAPAWFASPTGRLAATRNSGACAAQGDRFVFVDADTIVDETVMRAALQALREGAVGGGSAVRFDGRVPAYARAFLVAIILLFRACRWAAGSFVFCTRRAFEAAGGFDETLYASEEIAFTRALKRQGRFVVLRQAVTTSGRRIRAYSALELLGIVARLAIRGPSAVRSRRGVGMWYENRREDPNA